MKAVLFDLDGTLLDTLDDLADSMNTVLARLGFSPHPRDAYRRFVGDGMEILSRRSLPERARDAETVARCFAGMREEYGKRWAEKTRAYDGISELLDELALRHVPVAVHTNKPHDFALQVVNRFFGDGLFVCVIGQRPGYPKKPDPAGALAIAHQLGVRADACLFVGDSDTDMRTATAAGMWPVGALWGFRDAEELRAHGAKTLVGHPREILSGFEFG